MRDPKRILSILTKLNSIWHKYPDLRFGQLVENCNGTNIPLFYLEDEKFEKLLDSIIERGF